MKIKDIQQFIADMEARGYRQGQSFHTKFKPEHSLWKSFHKGEDEWEHNGYQICISVWDNRKYNAHAGVNTSFDMKINHQTPIQCDCMDIHMMDDTMDPQEFERRCEALWNAMLKFMPRKHVSAY